MESASWGPERRSRKSLWGFPLVTPLLCRVGCKESAGVPQEESSRGHSGLLNPSRGPSACHSDGSLLGPHYVM